MRRVASASASSPAMAADDDWESLLDGHPIFSQSNTVTSHDPLELSLSSLQNFTNDEESDDGSAPSGRRRVMCMKDVDLIVACRSEVRMTSLGDAKISGGSQRTYKVRSQLSPLLFAQ